MENEDKHWNLAKVVDSYRRAFAAHGDSPAAVQWPRGRQEIRFDALTRHFQKADFSILDFGCGLAHLKDFLAARFSSFRYCGVDIVPEFIDEASKKHRDAEFKLIKSHLDVVGEFDYVAISGAFNLMYGEDEAQHRKVVRDALVDLFRITRIAMSANFMTDRADYRQPHAYHENVADMHGFLCDKLSPRLVLNQAYMPFEFTVTVYRDQTIVRPDVVYPQT